MNSIKRFLSFGLILLFLLSSVMALADESYDASRTEHDIGTCRTLSEDAALVILFAKDDVSSWDQDSISDVYQRVEEVAQFFREHAASYGYELTLPVYCYTDNERREIRYSGVIETGGAKLDALSSIAENWGYENEHAMHEALQEYTGMEQLAYIVAINKSSYSYAQSQSAMGAYLDWCDPEYCVISIRNESGGVVPPAVYAHELLHMFGAQDFYRKEIGGVVYNDKRSRLCKKLCPDAIMLDCWNDLSETDISSFTAYCVGWIDFLPANYDVSDWWSDTQWADYYTP